MCGYVHGTSGTAATPRRPQARHPKAWATLSWCVRQPCASTFSTSISRVAANTRCLLVMRAAVNKPLCHVSCHVSMSIFRHCVSVSCSHLCCSHQSVCCLILLHGFSIFILQSLISSSCERQVPWPRFCLTGSWTLSHSTSWPSSRAATLSRILPEPMCR